MDNDHKLFTSLNRSQTQKIAALAAAETDNPAKRNCIHSDSFEREITKPQVLISWKRVIEQCFRKIRCRYLIEQKIFPKC